MAESEKIPLPKQMDEALKLIKQVNKEVHLFEKNEKSKILTVMFLNDIYRYEIDENGQIIRF